MNGIINVYKEKGYTSHDVVAKLRGILHQKKIGHTGTLDPEAEGVLPVCVGNATRVCDLLTDKNKEYEAVLLLGVTTDTLDMTGRILSIAGDYQSIYPDEAERLKGLSDLQIKAKENDESILSEMKLAGLSEGGICEIIHSFTGRQLQIPPMYSALKVRGKKLYEFAREGREIERKPREVMISRIEILRVDLPRVRFRVECSKGTYIRSLCDDIGRRAGCGAAMESLLRTGVGPFYVNRSLKLSEIERLVREGREDQFLMPVDELFRSYPAYSVTGNALKALMNGNCLENDMVSLIRGPEEDNRLPGQADGGTGRIRIYDTEGRFYAIYGPHPDRKGLLKPVKMFL